MATRDLRGLRNAFSTHRQGFKKLSAKYLSISAKATIFAAKERIGGFQRFCYSDTRKNNTHYEWNSMEQFEDLIKQDLHHYLLTVGEVDEHLPDCLDVENLWETIAKAYIPDGIREFQDYPTASLGWMMYIGLAVAKLWDTDWQTYAALPDPYAHLRDKRGYDSMDEYIREEILQLAGNESTRLEQIAGECASRVHHTLLRRHIEPGTKEAFDAYVSCLHQLYLMGAAMQLHRMGYHMTKID